MTFQACYAHSDYPRQNCPDCHALRNSIATRTLQDDLDECRRAFNFDELIRHVEAHMRGEVE